jgi:hypothetical protein
LQINYGSRVLDGEKIALYGEVNFLASPLRDVSSGLTSVTANVASLYVTPGIRLKVLPRSRYLPGPLSEEDTEITSKSTTRLPWTPFCIECQQSGEAGALQIANNRFPDEA